MLKRYADFRQSDFINHPIWMCVFNVDVDEPWYEQTDEITYRPWVGSLPYHCSDPESPNVVVRTRFVLSDGISLDGFTRPPFSIDGKAGYALSYRHPQLFLSDGTMIGFWLGGRSSCEPDRHQLYSRLGKTASQVFPITYESFPNLIDISDRDSIDGFYFGYDNAVVER